ncbi:site-specific integrase [Yoonia algicola]|uniref:Site-specific integrase n=1 Tax=Yoonia algicola TaxID=3137368 RepID=A0AAN0M4Z0_9RHOB
MDHAEIRATVYKYFKAQLETGKQRVNKNGPFEPQQVEHYQQTLDLLKDGNKSFWHTMGRAYAQTELDRFYDVTGLSAVECRDIQPMILDEIRKARIGAYEAVLEHAEGLERYDFTAAPRALSEAPAGPSGQSGFPSLSEAVKAFFRINEKSSDWTPGTMQKRQAVLDLALEWFGPEIPMDQIKKRDASDFKEALIALPVNRSKVFRLRGMTLREMIAVEDLPKISNATINAHLSVFKVFWDWAEKHDYAPEALFQNMAVGKKSAGSKQRAPFSQMALELSYDALTNPQSKFYGKTSHRWATLIAMFTGARLNEVCQLQTEDITTEDGIPVFDFTDAGDNLKRIKSAAGNRRVPIHSKLIDLGIMQYRDEIVAAGHEQLFPDYSYHPKHGYGGKLSKWFNRTFVAALGIKSEANVFHGLRHTFATRLGQADVQTEMIQFVLGHERQGVTHQFYVHGYTAEQSKRAIESFTI